MKEGEVDSIARKFGLREVVYPDREQVEALTAFLSNAVDTGRCGRIPKMAAVVMLEYLQGAVNRQYTTKNERMSQEEFDIL